MSAELKATAELLATAPCRARSVASRATYRRLFPRQLHWPRNRLVGAAARPNVMLMSRGVFAANSCVVADVAAFAQSRRAQGRPTPRYDRAALHRHAGRRRRARALVRAGQRSVGALFRVRRRPHRAAGPGKPPRLARRRRLPGPARPISIRARSASRSPIRATTYGYPRFSQAPDRGRDRAVPQHPDPEHDSAGARAGAFRCRAVAQAGSGREISLAHACTIRASVTG